MLTAVVLCKNEKDSLSHALTSLQFANELIVVDDFSVDESPVIAKKMGATIVQAHVGMDFAQARNKAMHMAKGEWVLCVDADEQVSPQLAVEIRKIVDRPEDPLVEAYALRRREFFWGKELLWGETRSASSKGILRLVKKGAGTWHGKVHEEFVVRGKTGVLKSALLHYPHPTIAQFLAHVNTYSSLRAHELSEAGKKTSAIEMVMLPFGKFIYTYFIRQGFRDGPAGFVYSFMMSFHSFLVRAKLYLS